MSQKIADSVRFRTISLLFVIFFLFLSATVFAELDNSSANTADSKGEKDFSQDLYDAGNENFQETVETEDEISQEMIDDVLSPDPVLFEALKSFDSTLTSSGFLPFLTVGQESYDWSLNLKNTTDMIVNDRSLEPYLSKNNGWISGFGFQDGYVIITVPNNTTVSKEEMDSVIQIVTDTGEECGCENIPIIIQEEELPSVYPSKSPAFKQYHFPIFIFLGFLILSVFLLSQMFFEKKD